MSHRRISLLLVSLMVAGCRGDSPSDPATPDAGAAAELARAPAVVEPARRQPAVWVPVDVAGVARRSDGSPEVVRRAPRSLATMPGGPPADTGPQLSIRTGKAATTRHPPVTVRASGVLQDSGHAYVRAVLPDPNPVAGRWGRWMHAEVMAGFRYGVAALKWGDSASADLEVHVRLVSGAIPKTVGLTWYEEGSQWPFAVRGMHAREVQIETGGAPVEKGLDVTFFGALAAECKQHAIRLWRRPSPFYSFAGSRLEMLAGRKGGTWETAQRTRRSDIGEAMSLYTGMTSVEEALQADRGLLLRSGEEGRTIPIETIEGVGLAQHPWEEMIAELGKKPQTEPLAAVVPHDMAYMHFHDLRTAVKLAGELDRWVTPLMQLLEWRSGTSHMTSRYEEALMVERTGLAEKLGHLAARSVALAIGDPFLRDGADVSLVFDVRNQTLLDSALGAYEAAARQRHPDLSVETYRLGEHPVRFAHTRDRRVTQHRIVLGGALVVSNSRRAVERFVAVHDGKAPSLGSRGDFRYMRAVYPYGDENEDFGFLFIGDDFVQKAVSPSAKILQARRMAAQADLLSVGYAALLYGWLEGKQARDVADVLDAGLLSKEELRHTGGAAIRFDPRTGASSDEWRTAAALTPLAEASITHVTESERQAYDRFRETYQRYWRAFVDPVAIRLVRDERTRRISIDGRMLPLIEASEYDELIRTVGRTTLRIPRAEGTAQLTVAIGDESPLRRELDRAGKFLGLDISFGWLGDFVTVGVGDRSGVWDAAILARLVPGLPDETLEGRARDVREMQAADRFPIFLAVQVRNPLALAATLTAVRAFVEGAAPGLVTWRDGPAYRGVKTVDVVARLDRREETPDVSLHYAVVGDVLVASLDKATLLHQVDAVLDQKTPSSASKDDERLQSVIELSPESPDGWLARTAIGLLEKEVHEQHVATYRDLEVLRRGFGGLLPSGDALREAGLGYLTFEPQSVQAGRFYVDAGGHVRHERYGTRIEPVAVPIPAQGAPLTDLVQSLRRLRMGLAFEGEGRSRGLHVTGEWLRR